MSAYDAAGAAADAVVARLAAAAVGWKGAPVREATISAAITPPPSDAASSVRIAVERRNCISLAICPKSFLTHLTLLTQPSSLHIQKLHHAVTVSAAFGVPAVYVRPE